MKNLIKFYLLLFALGTYSFAAAPVYPFTGTYGVGKDDPSRIELKLNEDHTFTYRDHSNPTKMIDAQGTWELKGKTVLLKAAGHNPSFHRRWRFSENGKVAKSRKGLTFYRLLNPEKCK